MTRLAALLPILLLFGCAKVPPPPAFGNAVPLVSPGVDRSVGPRLNAADGRLLLSWMQGSSPGGTLYFSELENGSWSPAIDVVTDPAMFVNWADLPSVMPLGNDRWFSHWLSFSADGAYSYDVRIAFGQGGEPEWSEPLTPHDDGTPTEHGFVSTHQLDGGVSVIWLDGRNTLAPGAEGPDDHAGHGSTAGGMTLRAATVNVDGTLGAEQEVDPLVCDCCQTDIAAGTSGPLAVYRDRTRDETRDIYMSRRIDGRWQTGERFSFDDWTIAACPVNGPAITAHGDLVVVTWFTAANDRPKVSARISTDGGQSFGERITIAQNKVIGHADIVALNDQAVAISWLESGRHDTDDVRVRSLAVDGKLGPVQTVGRTALSRVVPQIAVVEDALLLAWSDKFNGEQRISSVRVPILPGSAD